MADGEWTARICARTAACRMNEALLISGFSKATLLIEDADWCDEGLRLLLRGELILRDTTATEEVTLLLRQRMTAAQFLEIVIRTADLLKTAFIKTRMPHRN